MFGAQKARMFLRPENRALRALLWFVIIFVPGGMLLLGVLAADTLQRRYREAPRVAEADLVDLAESPLSSLGTTRS
jgi:hypothetical protein